LLKPYLTSGYQRVSLYNKGRQCKLVHRLVAQVFIPNPNNKPDVNHINGCKTDNNVSNLEWVTPSEKMSHAHSNNLRPYVNTQGERNGFSKLSQIEAKEIKRLTKQKILSLKKIACLFNISISTVRDIKSGRRWKHLPY
jgi:DNA-binding transcriptional regulator YiaG